MTRPSGGDPAAMPLAAALGALAARAPASLAFFGDRLAPGGPGPRPAAALRERAAFDAALAPFARPFGAADRRALVSYWSQFYLAALLVPALIGLARLGRALPLGLHEVGFELDEAGRPARFLLADRPGGLPEPGAGLAALVDGHLGPFVELCHAHSGLARRALWGNAAVILDHAAGELGAAAPGAPALDEAARLLGWRGARDCPRSPPGGPMERALHAAGAGGSDLGGIDPGGARCRRVCCLRYRLPGVADCGALCPRAPRPRAPRPYAPPDPRPC